MSQNIPKIKESTEFNFFTSIWIVPLIALLISGWLAYQYYSELGPEIRIIFAKNEGLQAGQSQIKYKDIPIGIINQIKLQKDGEGVEVIARMDKSVKQYLNQESKFWIVKPEVGISGISGLDTLISGTYINMYASKKNTKESQLKLHSKFIGLDYPYRNISGGEYFILNTRNGESAIKEGTPIYLKNIKVGQVEYVVLSLDNATIDVIVFIDKLYTDYIHKDSKFWVRSALDVHFKNGNLDVAVAPLTDLLQGAIAFSTAGKNSKTKVPNGYIFNLYKNKNDISVKKLGFGGEYLKPFVLYTDEKIANLPLDSAILFEGFTIGKIKKIDSFYSKKERKIKSQIFVTIDTSIFRDKSDINHTGEENFYEAVTFGLRAKIVADNPLMQKLHIALGFEKNVTQSEIIVKNNFRLLPLIKDSSDTISETVFEILDKINSLKLDKLISSMTNLMQESIEPVNNINDMISELKKSVININRLTRKKSFNRLPDEVNKTLKELKMTLKMTKNVIAGYKNNSLLSRQISQTLNIITKTSKEMKTFLRLLNRKPNSMVFGDK